MTTLQLKNLFGMSFLWPYLHQHFQFHPASTASAAAAVDVAASVQVAATADFSGELLMVHERVDEFTPVSRPLIKGRYWR